MSRHTKNKSILVLTVLLTFCAIVYGYSRIEFSVPESDIIFSHSFHVGEQEIECEMCHIEISSSQKATDRNMPTMDECAACHDVEDDETCGMCHRNVDEPEAIPEITRAIAFNHAGHLEHDLQCRHCHGDVADTETLSSANFPDKPLCMDCHDNRNASSECVLCHEGRVSLLDIHPNDWKHQHGDLAAADRAWCTACHREQNSCLECHRGDNLSGQIHDLNFEFTHALEAKSKSADCRHCHETENFCTECHQGMNRMPLNHSLLSWLNDHGSAARTDVENCAVCHDSRDPSCARGGCHIDFDGIRGTDPVIHRVKGGQFDAQGDWHDNNGSFCYQCHTSTGLAGDGFCGYCHGPRGE